PSLADPRVHQEVDDVVLSALERDPKRRWSSAASMGERIRTVSAQLGHQADERRVIEWVNRAFDQKRGRAPQLTPMMAMPVYAAPPAAPRPARLPPAPRRLSASLWAWCAVAMALLVIGALAWMIAR